MTSLHSTGSAKRYIFKNASLTATLSALGTVSGLVLDALILGVFGAGSRTDALFIALTVPLIITSVFSIQSPKILIPVFSEYFRHNRESEAWQLLRNLLTISGCVLTGICLLGTGLSSVVVALQIPGLESTTIAAGVSLSRIVFWLVLCQGLASIMQSVLYAQDRFLIASSGKLLTNVVTIMTVVLYHARFDVRAVAGGMLLGNAAHVILLMFALSRRDFRYRWVLNPGDRHLHELIRSFRNPLAGHVVGESGVILQNVLCSFLGVGSVTVMRYASRVVQALAGILLGSVVQVTLPIMARHAAASDLKAQRRTLMDSVQLLTGVGVPVCIWLVLAAEPLVILLFERGEFSRADAALTALLIRLMVPDVLLGRIVSVTQTLFYANMDTRTPLISTLIFAVSHAGLAILLTNVFGIVGLPVAVSLASLSNAVYMIVALQSRFGPVGWREIRDFPLRLAATCVIGGAAFTIGTKLLALTTFWHPFAKVIGVAMPTALGISAFIAGALLFRLVDIRLAVPIGRRAL